ncbi:Transposase [Enterobacter rongchengensis]
MTDVISGKNRKPYASLKVVLPIFTQALSAGGGYFFCRNALHQYEQRFEEIYQINLL